MHVCFMPYFPMAFVVMFIVSNISDEIIGVCPMDGSIIFH